MKSGDNRIVIELPKGLKLVAEQNVNPEYQNEIYVGIETSDGILASGFGSHQERILH